MIGKGYSVKKGILNSRGDYALFTDADLSTPINELDKFLKYISDYDIVNNQYIELLTETGWVGLSAFLFLIIFIIWRGVIAFYKSRNRFIKYTLVGLMSAFVATMFQYNFFSTLYIIPIWILIGIFIAVQNLAFKDEK